MERTQKQTLAILAGMACLYFILFLWPNAMGTRDANMLQVFEVDEFAQYPHVIRMLTQGETLYQTFRNFVVYLHYFYGYPFYFFSALALLPVRLIYGSGWESQTATIMLTLRQVINVLPALLTAGLLTWLVTRFRSRLQAGLFFAFIMTLPGMTVNNLWWHPDSIGLLFVVLTLFFLERDDFRFGRFFYLAAFTCGIAFGIKYLGAYFVFSVPIYILWGVLARHISWRRGVLVAVGFVGVMAAAVVVSNPLLLAPIERSEIIAIQKLQVEQTTMGAQMKNVEPFLSWGNYPEDFRIHYGEWYFYLLGMGVLIANFWGERKRLAVLCLAYCLPLSLAIINSGTRRTHYFLPAVLLIYIFLAEVFPGGSLWARANGSRIKKAVTWAAAGLVLFQATLFVKMDIGTYSAALTREQTSPALAFNRALEEKVLAKLQGEKLVAYRDWMIYLPSRPGLRSEFDWGLASPDLIKSLNPDLIVLEQAYVELFTRSDAVETAADPGDMIQMQKFYGEAASDRLPGYRLVYQDAYGLCLVRESLYLAHLKSP